MLSIRFRIILFFFFNDTATTEIYTLSLHDALPIDPAPDSTIHTRMCMRGLARVVRSEEHTSELQSRFDIVCRLLLEKKNNINIDTSVLEEIKIPIYDVFKIRDY